MTEPNPTDVRRALLDAARAELIDQGHAGIGLRAVARRAGVSHAAPGYHFTDRRGLLTALATEGYRDFSAALTRATGGLGSLGRVYVDFGLAHPALFDLMFHPTDLDLTDAALLEAKRRTLGLLAAASNGGQTTSETPGEPPPLLALESWAVVHGLVMLARGGALADAARTTPDDTTALARTIAADFAHRVGR